MLRLATLLCRSSQPQDQKVSKKKASRFFHLLLLINFYFSVLFCIYPKFPYDVQDRALVVSSIYRPRPILSSVDICNEAVLCSTSAHNIGVIVDQSHATSGKRSAFAMVQPWKQPLRKAKALEFEKRGHCVRVLKQKSTICFCLFWLLKIFTLNRLP